MTVADLALALRHHSTVRNRTSLKCTALDGLLNVAYWLLLLHNKRRRDRNRSRSDIYTVDHGSCFSDRNHSLRLHGDSLFFTSRPRVRMQTHTLADGCNTRTHTWMRYCFFLVDFLSPLSGAPYSSSSAVQHLGVTRKCVLPAR